MSSVRADLFTIERAAVYLGVSKSHLYNKPEIPRFRLGRRYYFLQKTLDQYIETKNVEAGGSV
jgi:excisionase family DNA binding protein